MIPPIHTINPIYMNGEEMVPMALNQMEINTDYFEPTSNFVPKTFQTGKLNHLNLHRKVLLY